MNDAQWCVFYFFLLCFATTGIAQDSRTVSGTTVAAKGEIVQGVMITAESRNVTAQAVTNLDGRFTLTVSSGSVRLKIEGDNIRPKLNFYDEKFPTQDLRIVIEYATTPVNEIVTIHDESLSPQTEFRNEAVYRDTLFSRDDQLVQGLNAGINAGQHEGGGKSLEVRRYGFNLNHAVTAG